nr:hypothetical protein [Tanacetum cinerariifolium]
GSGNDNGESGNGGGVAAGSGCSSAGSISSSDGMNSSIPALGQTLVNVGTQDSIHNQEMAGPEKHKLHMHMGPLASQVVHRLLEIR